MGETHSLPSSLGTHKNVSHTPPQLLSSLEMTTTTAVNAPPTAVSIELRTTDVSSHNTLLSSVDPALVPGDPVSSSHQALVSKIEEALSHNSSVIPSDDPSDSDMAIDAKYDSEMEADNDLNDEPDDDMTLVQYQREVKLEALARRDSSKTESQPKKGRNSP